MAAPRKAIVLLVAVGVLSYFCAAVEGAIIANFSGGNGTAQVDQYTGTPGMGWGTAWVPISPTSGTVLNTNPLSPGSGNYLALTFTGSSGSGSAWRQYDGVDRTKAHTISWQFRLDDTLNGNDVSIQDRDGTGGISSSASSFIIRLNANNEGGMVANQWAFYDGLQNNGGFSTSLFVDSGLTAVVGTTYSFEVTLRPEDREWDVRVTDGVTTVSQNGLGFRRSAFNTPGYLGFGADVGGSSGNLRYSIDNVNIVPEPAALLIWSLMAGLGAVLAWTRRRGH